MVNNPSSWRRPKTSAGFPTPTNDSSSILPTDITANSASASSFSSNPSSASSSSSPTVAGAVLSAFAGRLPTDNTPSLTARRSTHEFFNSARSRDTLYAPGFGRPQSSYVRGFTAPEHNLTTASASRPIQLSATNRLKASFDDARGALTSMARKALHNSTRDMRPVERLESHDSTFSNIGSSSVAMGPYDTPSSSSVDGASGSAPSSANILPVVPTHSSRPRSIRRLSRTIRDRAALSRVFHPGRRASSASQQPYLQGGAGSDEENPLPQDAYGDVVMGNTAAQQQHIMYRQGGGAAARAAAAEHNHGRVVDQLDNVAEQRPFHDVNLDAEMSDDTRITKRRRSGRSRGYPDYGDNGYDSMEVDEVTDQRRSSKPATRTDLVGKLPTEIAAHILTWLDDAGLTRCARVSRRWHDIAMSAAVWRGSYLGRYARAKDNVLPYIQFGGQGLGRDIKKSAEWLRMARARRALEKNWRSMAPKAVYFVGHTDSVYCCQFDEDKIITGSRDRTIRVWDLNPPFACRMVIGGPYARPNRPVNDAPLETHPTNTIHQGRSLNGTARGDAIYHVPSDFHTASILCLQFDKQIMVTGSSDHTCLVWDMKTFEPIQRLVHHQAGVLDVCMDDEYIISCSKDSQICVWSRKDFTLIKALTGHRGPVNAVQLREIKSRKLLVSASGDGLAKIWDLKKLEVQMSFNSQDRGLAAVEFSDDGNYVLAGGNDQVIYKFDAQHASLEHTFRGHTSLVRSLFLDSANARVVSGSYDQGIRVYDFKNGDLIGSYDNWTTSWILAAKSDYRRIVATSQDGRALLMDFGWGVPDIELLAGHKISTGLDFALNYGQTTSPVA